jgi:hypothetical protein
MDSLPIPIETLSPESAPPPNRSIRAIVTILWPYSSSTRQCALLLADPDFRLRSRKGQVRVRFTGASAEAVAHSRVGIGDEVVLELRGAAWASNVEATRTPGKSVDGELVFRRFLGLKVRGIEGGERRVEVDAPPSPPRAREDGVEGFAETPIPRAVRSLRGSLNVSFPDSGPVYSSPAFAKRLRLSGDTFVDSAYDLFSDDGGFESRSRRKRTSFGDVRQWRYAEGTPSPVKERFARDVEVESAEDEDLDARSPLQRKRVVRDDESTEVAVGGTSRTGARLSPTPMAPPALPRLEVPETQPTIDTRQPEVIKQAETDEPPTPKLKAVPNSALPLPSPFPAGVAQRPVGTTAFAEALQTRETVHIGEIQVPEQGGEDPNPTPNESMIFSTQHSVPRRVEYESDTEEDDELYTRTPPKSQGRVITQRDDVDEDIEMLDDTTAAAMDDEVAKTAPTQNAEKEPRNIAPAGALGVTQDELSMEPARPMERQRPPHAPRPQFRAPVPVEPRTPVKAPPDAFSLDGASASVTSSPAPGTTPQSEKDKIMKQTFKSLFGFRTSPGPPGLSAPAEPAAEFTPSTKAGWDNMGRVSLDAPLQAAATELEQQQPATETGVETGDLTLSSEDQQGKRMAQPTIETAQPGVALLEESQNVGEDVPKERFQIESSPPHLDTVRQVRSRTPAPADHSIQSLEQPAEVHAAPLTRPSELLREVDPASSVTEGSSPPPAPVSTAPLGGQVEDLKQATHPSSVTEGSSPPPGPVSTAPFESTVGVKTQAAQPSSVTECSSPTKPVPTRSFEDQVPVPAQSIRPSSMTKGSSPPPRSIKTSQPPQIIEVIELDSSSDDEEEAHTPRLQALGAPAEPIAQPEEVETQFEPIEEPQLGFSDALAPEPELAPVFDGGMTPVQEPGLATELTDQVDQEMFDRPEFPSPLPASQFGWKGDEPELSSPLPTSQMEWLEDELTQVEPGPPTDERLQRPLDHTFAQPVDSIPVEDDVFAAEPAISALNSSPQSKSTPRAASKRDHLDLVRFPEERVVEDSFEERSGTLSAQPTPAADEQEDIIPVPQREPPPPASTFDQDVEQGPADGRRIDTSSQRKPPASSVETTVIELSSSPVAETTPKALERTPAPLAEAPAGHPESQVESPAQDLLADYVHSDHIISSPHDQSHVAVVHGQGLVLVEEVVEQVVETEGAAEALQDLRQEQLAHLPTDTAAPVSYPILPPSPFDSQLQAEVTETVVVERIRTETVDSTMPPTPQLTQRESDLQAEEQQPATVHDNAASQSKAPKAAIAPDTTAALKQQEPPSAEASETPSKTPSRKSLKARISSVPDVISAWFSPKGPKETEKKAQDVEQQVEDQEHVNGIASASTNGHIATITQPRLRKAHSNGVSTSMGYFTPLSSLEERLNPASQQNEVDVVAVVTDSTTAPARAKGGPRDYYTIFRIGDTSLADNTTIRVEVFRPWKAVLPLAEVGDVILLRSFAVKSRKRQPYLLSTDASAWCVWRFAEGVVAIGGGSSDAGSPSSSRRRSDSLRFAVREEVKGPPIEYGEEERSLAKDLRDWWVGEHGKGEVKRVVHDDDDGIEGYKPLSPQLAARL